MALIVVIISLGNSAHLVASLCNLNGADCRIWTLNKEKASRLGKHIFIEVFYEKSRLS
jgi:hypothetical protein